MDEWTGSLALVIGAPVAKLARVPLGYAARCAVVAPPHRSNPYLVLLGLRPNGTKPQMVLMITEGQRPSAHQEAKPRTPEALASSFACFAFRIAMYGFN